MDYITISDLATDEFTERKSLFIGTIKPVKTEEEAVAFVSEMKQKYWDATHNVYAYVLREGQTRRYSDDGEPQGTAGMPVLDVLLKENVTDLAVVVTRYFGGILLGAGGLVRAYSHGAKIALDAAEKLYMCMCSVIEMEYDYSTYGKIANILPNYKTKVVSSDFGVLVKQTVIIKDEFVDKFMNDITELTAARVVPVVVDKVFDNIV